MAGLSRRLFRKRAPRSPPHSRRTVAEPSSSFLLLLLLASSSPQETESYSHDADEGEKRPGGVRLFYEVESFSVGTNIRVRVVLWEVLDMYLCKRSSSWSYCLLCWHRSRGFHSATWSVRCCGWDTKLWSILRVIFDGWDRPICQWKHKEWGLVEGWTRFAERYI